MNIFILGNKINSRVIWNRLIDKFRVEHRKPQLSGSDSTKYDWAYYEVLRFLESTREDRSCKFLKGDNHLQLDLRRKKIFRHFSNKCRF